MVTTLPARIVAYSTRLGGLTEHERRIAALPGTELREVSLRTEEELLANAADAAVLWVGAIEPLSASVLAKLPRCLGIVRRGVGHDNVDVEAATSLGIMVANVPDASIEEVSDHALALALALVRHVAPLDHAVRDGLWASAPAELHARRAGVRRLNQLTLGVVGAGRIGLALVRKASGVFGQVLAADPVVPAAEIEAQGGRAMDLEALLGTADVISLHAPLLPSTHHLIGARTLPLVKRGALLVNTSRGQLVDQAAVADALRDGRLAGAALDVTDPEPMPADHPLLAFGNVLVTGHSAATSDTSAAEMRRRSAEAVEAILDGRPAASVVNPAVLEQPGLRLRGGSEA